MEVHKIQPPVTAQAPTQVVMAQAPTAQAPTPQPPQQPSPRFQAQAPTPQPPHGICQAAQAPTAQPALGKCMRQADLGPAEEAGVPATSRATQRGLQTIRAAVAG